MLSLLLLATLAAAPDAGQPEVHEPLTAIPVPYRPDIEERWLIPPPCGPLATIDGFCFVRTMDKPPCPATTKAHGSGCYQPLVRLPSTPPRKK